MALRSKFPGLVAGVGAVAAVAIVGLAVLLGKSSEAPRGAPGVASVERREGMVRIPGGSFWMGSDEDPSQEPVHRVDVSAFWMDETEVTVAAYSACASAGGCPSAPTTVDWKGITETQRKQLSTHCNGDRPDRKTHSINCVDWEQATTFCKWSNKRLPTEEEWEYAARGSDGRKYPWGDSAPRAGLLNACGSACANAFSRDVAELVNQSGAKAKAMYGDDDGWPETAPVGSFPAGKSPFGLHDMAGNVSEWTSSSHGWNYREKPSDPLRVSRGGGWHEGNPALVRSTYRSRLAPASRLYALGFRCARTE